MNLPAGKENNNESDATTLSLFSFPSNLNKAGKEPPPGMLTPPFNAAVSIPFQWEEAPGKPRLDHTESQLPEVKSAAVRCLELPPRLLLADHHQTASATKGGGASADIVSPTTVLDGPDVGGGRSLCRTLSFRKGGSKERGLFGSSRWGSTKKLDGDKEVSEGSFDFLCLDDDGRSHGDGARFRCSGGGHTKVKIIKFRKRPGSFMSFSNSNSHNLLTSIYESFKQAVPWRRRQDRSRSQS